MEHRDSYQLSGKTGWSIHDGHNNGWFVGYVKTKHKTYFFATNVEPNQPFDMDLFPRIRKDVTSRALGHMEIISSAWEARDLKSP